MATYQTRGVLAGAYKGRQSAKALLTHLVDTSLPGEPGAVCGRAAHMADEYSDPAGNALRPTCPVCAKRWDKLNGIDVKRGRPATTQSTTTPQVTYRVSASQHVELSQEGAPTGLSANQVAKRRAFP